MISVANGVSREGQTDLGHLGDSTEVDSTYTLRGFAQDARGAINDVLDSFTLPVFGGFMLGGIILGLSLIHISFKFGRNRQFRNFYAAPGVRYWLLESYMGGFIGMYGTCLLYTSRCV